MHQLLEDVLPWFLALYVLDSLALVHAHELLFVRVWSGFAPCVRGLVLAGLAPQAEVVSALELPVRLGRAGVAFPHAGGWQSVPWEALGPIAAEQRLVRCSAGQLKAPTAEAARRLAALLVALRDEAPERRWSRAQALADAASDVGALRARRALHLRHARVTDVLGWALLLGAFGLLPLSLGGRLLPLDPLVVLLALAPVHAIQVLLSWRTLRALGLAPGAAAASLSTLVFFPPGAAHVRSLLSRTLYADFDALALGAVLMPRERFLAQARERYHRTRLELLAEPEFGEHAQLGERVWRRALSQAGIEPAEVLRSPRAQDASATSYCPLCSAEYRAGFATCSDCRVPLEPLGA